MSYLADHKQVYKARGKASQHDCVICGGQAQQWATIHGRDGTSVGDYCPMCVLCHSAYDDRSGKMLGNKNFKGHSHTPETIAKMKANMTEERRAGISRSLNDQHASGARSGAGAKISAAKMGHHVSDETRAKLREAWARRKAGEQA